MQQKPRSGKRQSATVAIFSLATFISSGLIGNALAANIVRGPYVQMGTHNSMHIRWETDEATSTRVQYGTSQNQLVHNKTDSTAKTTHVVELTGLSPLTRYYYSIGSNDKVLAGNDNETYFETSPLPGQSTPTRIWVIGDPGRAGTDPTTQDQQYVLNGYNTFNGQNYTDFWLMLGDNAYNDGTIQEYQNAVFNQYPRLLKQSPLWPAMGNHDNRTAKVETQTGGFYDLFTTPQAGQAGGEPSGHKGYYSFDYGDIHVVVLNSSDAEHNQLSGPMDEWLEKDLSNATGQWLIAIFHHAPYGKSGHDSDIESGLIRMRENFLPILEKHGVDLVMAGHNHYYTRTKLISKHYGLSNTFDPAKHVLNPGDGKIDGDGAYGKQPRAPYSGTVYITHGAGAGGGSGYVRQVSQEDINSGKRHPSDFMYGGRGSMVIDINGDDMKVNVLGPQGAVLDYFTVRHLSDNGNQPPAATITGPTKAKVNESVNFSAAGSSDPDGTLSHYLWDFGDGQTSNSINPAHTYSAAGDYTIGLTVTDNGGLTDSANASITIESASNVLQNGQTIKVSGEQKSQSHFTLPVPDNAKDLKFTIAGGSGDADLYVRYGQPPSKSDYDCRPYKGGNNEQCSIEPAVAGTYYVMLYGYNRYSDISLSATYTLDDNPPTVDLPDACQTQAPISDGRLRDGEVQCLADKETIWLSIGDVSGHQSIAITTAHGTGNLDLEFSNQGWPNGDNVDASSAGNNNQECIWLENLDQYWGYLKVSGSNGSAAIVVDFDADTCRLK